MVYRVGLALLLTLFTIVYDTKKGGLLNASSKVVAGDVDDCGHGGGGGEEVSCNKPRTLSDAQTH
jgi:hypothetical protein